MSSPPDPLSVPERGDQHLKEYPAGMGGQPARGLTPAPRLPVNFPVRRPGRAFRPLRESRSFRDFPPGRARNNSPHHVGGTGWGESAKTRGIACLSAVLPCRIDLYLGRLETRASPSRSPSG